jgi:dienelactone hydrolase
MVVASRVDRLKPVGMGPSRRHDRIVIEALELLGGKFMRCWTKRLRAPGAAVVVLLALTLASCTNGGGGGGPAGGGIQNGPVNTGMRGPVPVASKLAGAHAGFGGATIHYPLTPGTYGGIVIVPGFISVRQQVGWLGPMLASHGFVVMVIDTLTVVDLPAARAAELSAAVNFLANQSPGQAKVDGDRMGLMGWSMGGGGTLEAADNRRVKAAIPMAPWDITAFPLLDTPTMVIACQGDVVAPPALMAQPFYNEIRAEKAYLAVPGLANHFCPTVANNAIAKFSVAWMKRWIDGDTRYSSVICGAGPIGARYKNTCPM